jgi:hypothetical protein
MRYLLITLLLSSGVSLAAEEFTTDAAKAAKAAYEADLKAAREKYSQALDEAAKKAVEAGELEEVVRIKVVKEKLSGKASPKSDQVERVLWKHKHGYFERLNDGHWVERVGNGDALLFVGSNVTDEYIEISRPGAAVRLYDKRSEVRFAKEAKRGFRRLYAGEWTRCD